MLSQLESNFQDIKTRLNGSVDLPVNQLKVKAMDSFLGLGLPTIKNEEWKYTNVKSLSSVSYNFHSKNELNEGDLESLNFSAADGNIIYFVNGKYDAKFSNIEDIEKVEVLTFKDAMKSNSAILNSHFSEIVNNETEAFTAMNTALAEDGIVIHVSKNVTLDKPIILRFISDNRREDVGTIVRNLLVFEENSEATVAESFWSIGEKKAFVNTVTEIFVDKNARIDYYKVQNESDETHHIGTTQVYQKDSSYFYSATATINGGFVRNNLNLIIDGEHVNSHMYGLYLPNKKQHIDNHTVVDHRKPNSESNELYKGILMDNSTGVFNGKIFVQQVAQKTNAYQNCKNVITSPNATMNTKPQLEIWADDVKCSHGTTTGQLNDEAIFYMQSRGIPKQEAIKLQLLAFANDVIKEIKIDSVREYLESEIATKLGQIN